MRKSLKIISALAASAIIIGAFAGCGGEKKDTPKAAELGLGSVILFGFIRHLGENAEYIKKMNLPEGVYPLLGVAVGHGPGSAVKRKDDRHFRVLRVE